MINVEGAISLPQLYTYFEAWIIFRENISVNHDNLEALMTISKIPMKIAKFVNVVIVNSGDHKHRQLIAIVDKRSITAVAICDRQWCLSMAKRFKKSHSSIGY